MTDEVTEQAQAERAAREQAEAAARAAVPRGRTDEAEQRRRETAELNARQWWAVHFQIDRLRKQAARQIELIQGWLERKLEPLRRDLGRIELSLKAVGEAHVEASKKGKYIDTSAGRVSFGEPSKRLVVEDGDIAIAAVRAAVPSAITEEQIPARVNVKLVANELKKAIVHPTRQTIDANGKMGVVVEGTGEVLEGLHWEMDRLLKVGVGQPEVEIDVEDVLLEMEQQDQPDQEQESAEEAA
jgi:hypothetical protein